jgi:hypothetical protein
VVYIFEMRSDEQEKLPVRSPRDVRRYPMTSLGAGAVFNPVMVM